MLSNSLLLMSNVTHSTQIDSKFTINSVGMLSKLPRCVAAAAPASSAMLSAQPTMLNVSTAPQLGPRLFHAGMIRNRRAKFPALSRRDNALSTRVQAMVGEDKVATESSSMPGGADTEVKAVITIRRNMKEELLEKLQEDWESFMNKVGNGVLLQLVSEDIDPETGKGKMSAVAPVRGWSSDSPDRPDYLEEFAADFKLPPRFGRPGAILVTNPQSTELFLLDIVVRGFQSGPLSFPCNSYVHTRTHNPEPRIVFVNHAYLPSQTPGGLKDLRESDKVSLRGNGEGERVEADRIYDYDVYNDLGNPDAGLIRPILGGEQHPYPRRCRTGRSTTESDPTAESRLASPDTIYVPRDEAFEEVKEATFAAGNLKAVLHNIVPTLASVLKSDDGPFGSFDDIDDLYKDGVNCGNKLVEQEGGWRLLISTVLGSFLDLDDKFFKFNIPRLIFIDKFSWLRDVEFGRQTLAGVNPSSIERLTEFPIMSKLDPAIYGPPESAITKELLEASMEGMTVQDAVDKNRLFILDFHDMLFPYIERINSVEDRNVYASRTIFFLDESNLLKPIAVELSLPPPTSTGTGTGSSSSSATKQGRNQVFTPGHSGTGHWIWKWAKAHACSNDTGIHQLVNHWLRTHACMEAYIIASHRQLSCMHPVFKLLHPHMKYTMEINALARQDLISGDGVIESCFSPAGYSMELSSAAYAANWRFDKEGLPADLLRRGMAVEDASMPCGIKLVIEDYPYAADGLLIWSAIKEWVGDFIAHFYRDDDTVSSDTELQAWWEELKNKGHEDKKKEPWWPSMKTREDLEAALTTMIWTASGQHAAVNFGQYPIGGYMPNRPTVMKTLIPKEDEPEYEKFLKCPQDAYLASLPSVLETTKVMAVQDSLSTHASDEDYLGKVDESHSIWIDDEKILSLHGKFASKLVEIEEIIKERNNDKRLKHRNGAGILPYELLMPTSGPGVTGRGIPNSISI